MRTASGRYTYDVRSEGGGGIAQKQCSNGIRIFAGASASSGSEAEAELFCTSAELFCTSVVAGAPGIDVASVVAGAPFTTGSSVVTYILDRSCCINRISWLNRSPVSTEAPNNSENRSF